MNSKEAHGAGSRSSASRPPYQLVWRSLAFERQADLKLDRAGFEAAAKAHFESNPRAQTFHVDVGAWRLHCHVQRDDLEPLINLDNIEPTAGGAQRLKVMTQ
jgi:hypothetical protein